MYKMNLVYCVMPDIKELLRTTEVMSEELRGQYEEAKDVKILNINNNNCKGLKDVQFVRSHELKMICTPSLSPPSKKPTNLTGHLWRMLGDHFFSLKTSK